MLVSCRVSTRILNDKRLVYVPSRPPTMLSKPAVDIRLFLGLALLARSIAPALLFIAGWDILILAPFGPLLPFSLDPGFPLGLVLIEHTMPLITGSGQHRSNVLQDTHVPRGQGEGLTRQGPSRPMTRRRMPSSAGKPSCERGDMFGRINSNDHDAGAQPKTTMLRREC